MARYRKIAVRMWDDEKFQRLTPPRPCGQSLWIWLLTNPETTNIPGLYRAGEAAMAEALHWPLEAFQEAFQEVSREGMVIADWSARVVWVPNAIEYDQPQSPNVVKSWATTWEEIPNGWLKSVAYERLKAFLEGMGEAFAKAFAKACPKPSGKAMPNPEPEPDTRTREKEIPAPRACAREAAPSSPSLASSSAPSNALSIANGTAPPVRLSLRHSRTAVPHWQQMLDHMADKWSEMKRKKTGQSVPYPWPRDVDKAMKTLHDRADVFKAWGIMALWDLFLEIQDDKWVLQTGHSLDAFLRRIEKLVDDPRWKSLSRRYELQLTGPIGETVGKVLGNMGIVPPKATVEGGKGETWNSS